MKGARTMKRGVRRGLMLVLGLVFLGSAWMLIREFRQYRQGEETYQEAEELVQLPDLSQVEPLPSASAAASASGPASGTAQPATIDPYAQALRNMDFTALQQVNPEVLGWILIPDSTISYPLVQHDDNTYYLKKTWKKQSSAVGAIFLEAKNSADFSDFNTVIYGHNMNNGSMFGGLKKYKKQSYWAAHPNVYITDQSGSRCYEIFAAYEVSTAGISYQIGFASDASRQNFLDQCMALSVIDTGVVPTIRDRIVTLSTCTGRGHATRWVVQAVERQAVSDDPVEAPPEETVPAPEEPLTGEESGSEEASSAAAEDRETPQEDEAPEASGTDETAEEEPPKA